ncbi:MAG TPA: magnesium/cobalt transporter CorA [Gemmatimonadaceae bacterium]|nr:magnesium/cobalt transporter CorA [Gemmatimonadaceae bacterium]
MAVSQGDLTNAAPAEREPNLPASMHWDSASGVRHDLPLRELVEVVRSKRGELWVDIDSANRHQHALLEKLFHFHPLSIEDTLNPNSRVKVEEYDGYLFAIIRGVRFDQTTEDPYDLDTFNLCFFLGPNYLVTVHAEGIGSVDTVREHLVRNPELLARGAERLMHGIMDAAVDAYFPLLDQIDEFTHDCEEKVFVTFDARAMQRIFSVKRVVLSLRRHLAPQREVFNVLTNRPSALLNPEAQIYFRDIYDHVLRITEALETYRDLLGSTLDAYLTQVSNELGKVSKSLGVIATLSIPFVVISGMWGMNFARVPLADSPLGFWLMLGLQVGLGAALIALLKWRRWL